MSPKPLFQDNEPMRSWSASLLRAMTPDPARFPPQKCGLCGAILVPVPTPEGDGFDLVCGNPKCPRSREEIEEEEETP